jgi:nitrite reductase/ring-hydroxylating ferredoxin subunit
VSTLDFPRRTALIGAAVCPLAAACSSGDNTSPASTPASSTSAAAGPLAKTADIPVGTGKIVGNTLITQPEPGIFKAFVPRCTHAGCKVTVINGTSVDCPCHGSAFALDGSVTHGPASRPLDPVAITVNGDSIVGS